MSNTWRAFMSPLHEDKLGVTNNNKQDVSSFIISSRQTPQKKRDPSFLGSGQLNEGPPTSKTTHQNSQHILKQVENPSEFREQIDDIQHKVVTLKKKMMSVSPDKYPATINQNLQPSFNNQQVIYSQHPSLKEQQQQLSFQQNLNQQKIDLYSLYQGANTERLGSGQYSSETERSKYKKISILPHEFTQHSTTRSISNRAGSSVVKKNSFLEDFDNAHIIANTEDIVNPFYISDAADPSNMVSYGYLQKGVPDINIPQKEEQNETEMLKRCMLKIQQKLEKETQKRRELKMLIKKSNMSIGTLRQDISNYQLDMQLVKQITLNTTRAVDNRISYSTLRPSTTTASSASAVNATVQGTTVKKNPSSSTTKQMSKSKEKLSNLVNVGHQHPKQKSTENLKVFARRKSKSVSSTVMEFNQQGMMHIDLTSLESSDSSQEDIGMNFMQLQHQQGARNYQNQSYQQPPAYLKSEGETRTHQQQNQINRKGKARLSQEVPTFSQEIRQIQQQKKEKAQYYLSKLDKGKTLNIMDSSSSISSSNISALKFLQSNYTLQNQLKQKKNSKSSSKIINVSGSGKSNSKQSHQNPSETVVTTDQKVQKINSVVNSTGSSVVSNAPSQQQTVRKNESKDIILQKLNEFKKFKEALNSEINELKKEFNSNDPLLASLNFEKLKEKALKDKKILLGLENGQNTGKKSSELMHNNNNTDEKDNFVNDHDQTGDQDFQTPVTHERGAQSDVTTNQKVNMNQSHCNNNQRTASKTTISESRETASFEKHRQIQSKNFSKDLLSPSEDILNMQQNNSQIHQTSGAGQFLSNMLMTESYTGEEYLNSERKNVKKTNVEEKQKQDYKMFQNQLNYFKMQETLNKHLTQYENDMLEKQAALENQRSQIVKQQIYQQQQFDPSNQGQISQSDPTVKSKSDLSSDTSRKQTQNFQNIIMQQNKQLQMQNLIKQQQTLLAQQNMNNQSNNPANIMNTENSARVSAQQSNKQQILNSSEKKKGIEQFKKQLFPEGAEFSDEEFIYQQNNNQYNLQIQQQKQSICSNPVNINDYSTNDSQQQQQQQNSKEKSKQSFSEQVVTQPRYIENQNEIMLKQIKKQQSETLLANQQTQQQTYPTQSNQKTGQNSIHSNQTNQTAGSTTQQQQQLFYKTPQSQQNQGSSNPQNVQSNSNLTSAYSSTQSVNVKNLSPQQQLQQEQFALFLQQSNSHLHQSGGFTDRQHNKSSNSTEKMYPSADTFTSPLMNLKSPDLNKSQLKKSGKSSIPSLPKSPNSVINYYQDPINLSNITGVQSMHSESLNYTASIGTTPAKSNFYSTPLQNQSINNTSNSNNFFLTNTSLFQNTANNINISTPQQQNSSTVQQLNISSSNNNLNFTKSKSNHLSQNSQSQAYLNNNLMQEQSQQYITPQKK